MASKAEKKYQKDLQNLINQQYNAGQEYVAGQEARLQSFQPQYEQSIAQTYEAQAPELQRISQEQQTAIAQQQEQTKQQRESALAQARRQYQEGTQRTQQLFGGVAGSSAGQAQSELLAREQQRQFGQTQMASNQALGQLASNLQNVQAQTANQLVQLQADKQKALTQARDAFRQQLDTINSQRFQLAQDKANSQIKALQDFNTRRRQLEDFYTQQQANLDYYKAQQPIALNTYAQQLKLAQQYAPATQSLPNVNLVSSGFNNEQRLGDINKLLALSDTDLRKLGYFKDTVPVGNQNVNVLRGSDGTIFNTFNGERIR